MKHNLYVDNLISGCDSEQEVIDYYTESRSIMRQANFNLRSWSTNSRNLATSVSSLRRNKPMTQTHVSTYLAYDGIP